MKNQKYKIKYVVFNNKGHYNLLERRWFLFIPYWTSLSVMEDFENILIVKDNLLKANKPAPAGSGE